MLCSVCKKNMAVIFVNKLDKDGKNPTLSEGLCLDCAKKRGIDPVKTVVDSVDNLTPEQMENLTKQFEGLLGKFDPDSMSNMFGSFENMDFGPFNSFGEFSSFNQNDSEEEQGKDTKTKTKEKKANKKAKYLDTYGTNLTNLAKEGKLDNVVGRNKELERLIQILNRRTKNNAALIGEPGVGKTAVMNGLAIKIAQKQVPQRLQNKQVYLLDMASVVAGTQFRGQFEARMKGIIDECKSFSNIILAIDELHSIMGSSEHDNSMNAANMLKPALATGDIQIIGATTLKEYRKTIEKDAALERRFQPIILEEPNFTDTLEILKGVRPYYEKHHKVIIPDEALIQSISLAKKYIHDRFLPDKAIDLLDEACSRVFLDNTTLNKIESIEKQLEEISSQIEDTEFELANMDNNDNPETYEKAANLKTMQCNLEASLSNLNKKAKKPVLSFDNLARVVELWTNIPASRLSQKETEKLLNLETNLNKKIIGQEMAVNSLYNSILRKRANIKNSDNPPSFIFVGPTGVGKTALVKALAYELFDREDAIIRLDMSEYMESHSVSKLIGSPPGYVGYDEAGYLTEKVRRNPYSIVLFDEIEKAHPSVFNMLLQVLDDGRLTDSQGKTVSFKHTIIILTSNLGTNFKNEGYGFANNNIEEDMLKTKVNHALKEYFSPEFLNRIDDIIVFNKLNKENSLEITKLLLNELTNELKKKNLNISYTDKVAKYILSKGFDDKFGARPLKRTITKYIEDLVALKFIKNELEEPKEYILDMEDNTVVLKEKE